MSIWADLTGTISNYLRLGFEGVRLKSSSGKLQVRNSGDTAGAAIVVTNLELGNGDTVLQSGGSGITFILPSSVGSPNQALVTDGSGGLSFATIAGGNDKAIRDTTSLVFGSSSPVAMFTLPANAVIDWAKVIVDTAFDGTPTMSVGVTGNLSKYVASTQVDLTLDDSFLVYPDLAASGSSEDLIITYSAGGATVGAARVLVSYSIPS